MKAFFLLLCVSGYCVSNVHAQDNSKDKEYKRFSFSDIGKQLQDSLHKIKPLSLDSLNQKGDNSVNIPNLFAKGNLESYTMPIKQLNGKGLAPMPGTENLDKIDSKSQSDSLKIFRRYKK